ncbi:NADPH-dependent FMN reductase [Bradyrhizobium prioriisuperbiae]|uniref:NADPH-dependent FMN reductase n=1 Tax=Bradyrhizobium prioriisuperbiae TaxID=2854389 RepID=UPI0028E3A5AD|nr:NADPH-dependent FMN reductase [Bradyrhizobium prioritasuperba]
MTAPLIVGLGGTLRDGSTSERALRIALTEAERLGARTRIFAGALLNLPAYDPADPSRSVAAAELVEALRGADGIIVATPSYHGSISGLIKNAIDYTEDLRADGRGYFSGRAVGAIVCADGIQAMGATLATLRAIVHALRGWPTPFSAVINSALKPFAADGACRDPQVAQQLAFVAEQVVEFAQMRRLRDAAESDAGNVRRHASGANPQGSRLIELTLEFMN